MTRVSTDRGALGSRVVFVLALCGGFGPFAIDAYMPGLVAIANQFDVPAPTAQLTLTGFVLALGLGQLVLGPLSDQTGRRRILLLGLGGATLASLLCALAPTIWLLILGRVLQGAFGAAGVVLSRAIVADLAAGVGVARAFSLLMSVQSIAPVVAPVVGALIVPAFGWRAAFWFLSGLGVVMVVLAAVVVPESLPPHQRLTGGVRRALGDMATLLRLPAYAAAVVLFMVGFGTLFAYIAASPFVLQRIMGFTQVQYSIVFTVNSVAIFAANLVNARLVARVRPLRLITVFGVGLVCVVAWLAVTVLVLDLAVWAVLAGFLGLTVCMGFLFPNTSALAIEASGGRRGVGSAMMGAAQMTTAAIVAPLTGIGDGRTAVPMVTIMACCAVCVVAALLVLRGVRRRTAAAGAGQ